MPPFRKYVVAMASSNGQKEREKQIDVLPLFKQNRKSAFDYEGKTIATWTKI